MDNLNLPIRLLPSEAGRIFGVSTQSIRNAIKEGMLRYVIVKGRYRINFDSLLEWSQTSTRRRNLLSTGGVGKYVEQWKISNKKYSPNEELLKNFSSKLNESPSSPITPLIKKTVKYKTASPKPSSAKDG